MGRLTKWLLEREFFKQAVSMQAYKMTEQLKFPPWNTHRKFDEQQYAPELKLDYVQTYEKHIWIYSTVYAIASTLAQLPMRLYALDSKGNKGDEILDGWAYNLIKRPNPDQTRYDFIEALYSYMELTGDGFIEKSDPRMPTQLYVLRSDYMRINSSPNKLIVNYEYVPHGVRSTIFQPEDIIHFKYFHPRSETYGFSFVQAAKNSLVLDFDAIKFQKKFFEQGAAIDKFISVKKELSPTEYSRFKEEIRNEYSGVNKSHLPMVLDNDGEMKSVGVTMDKVMLGEQRASNRDEIFSGSGVPPIMANLLAGKETYNNAATQEKAFWQNTIKPKAQKVEDKLNVELFNKVNMKLEFDFSGVRALQEDMAVKATTGKTQVEGGIFTPNEVREKMYQEKPIAGGDTLRQPVQPYGAGMPAGMQQVPASIPSSAASISEDAVENVKPLQPLNGAQIASAIQVVQAYSRKELGKIAAVALLEAVGMPQHVVGNMLSENIAAPVTPAVVKRIIKTGKLKYIDPEKSIAFKPIFEATKKIMDKMQASVLSKLKNMKIKKAKYVDMQEVLSGLDAESLGMIEDLSEVESKAFIDIVSAQFSDVTGKEISQETLSSIEKRIAKQVKVWAKKSSDSIVKTMSDRVTGFLQEAESTDMSMDNVTRGIQEIFTGTERQEYPWARAIARTETLKTQSGGTFEAMKQGGYSHKMWIAGGAPGDRETHTALDGVTIPIEEPFVTSDGEALMYPGDPNANVKELVNCRCGMSEATEEQATA